MKLPLINALIDGATLATIAKEQGVNANKMTPLFKKEMKYVCEHPRNVMDDSLQDIITNKSAFAIRRNPRAWRIAVANATKKTYERKLQPMQHIFSASSIEEAFDICLKHDSITKKDAMILVYNTALKALTENE